MSTRISLAAFVMLLVTLAIAPFAARQQKQTGTTQLP